MESIWPLLAIAAAHLLAAISPGPSFLVVARTAVGQSRAAGVWAACGMGLASVAWALAALFGLDLLFRAAPSLYLATKLMGAGFLLFLAIRLLRHAGASAPAPGEVAGQAPSCARSLRLGLATQLANPKAAVFFGAIFVTLLPPERTGWVSPALLAIVFAIEFLWFAAVACLFSVARLRRAYLRLKRWIDRAAGLLLGVLGLRLVADVA